MKHLTGPSWKWLLVLVMGTSLSAAGVRDEIKRQYIQEYMNKALFLKMPVHGQEQVLYVQDSGVRLDRSTSHLPLRFKVGDQVRVLKVDFKNEAVEFELGSIDMTQRVKLVFRFSSELTADFYQRPAFESALRESFTEGLSYRELESAKAEFIQGQFDHLLEQFAATTGTSVDYVVKAVSEKNPEYRRAVRDAAEAREELQTVRQEFNSAAQSRQQLQAETLRLRGELSQAGQSLQSVTGQKDQLERENAALGRDLDQLRQTNRRHESQIAGLEKQINDLARSLDIRTADSQELGKRVQSLSTGIDSLKSDRASLSGKLTQVSGQLDQLQKEKEKLEADLKKSQEESRKSQAELSALTSNRNSLEARFVETRRIKEQLETADTLGEGLRLVPRLQEKDGVLHHVSDVYLTSQKIGSLDVELPDRAGQAFNVIFSLDSPDIVQFSDEERRLYQTLGEQVRVETVWESGNDLQPELLSGEPVRSLSPRDQVVWTWVFHGSPRQPQAVTFQAYLRDIHDQRIPLALQSFQVEPEGIWYTLKRSFSVGSLAVGFLAGFVLVAIAISMRRRSSPTTAVERGGRREYVVQKKL